MAASIIYSPPTPGILNSTALSVWITASLTAGRRDLAILPGVYAVAAPLVGMRAHVVLPPMANAVLDCAGVTLVMDARNTSALYLLNWQNTTLRGLSVRYREPPSNSAVILAMNLTIWDVRVEDGMPLDDWIAGTVGMCSLHDGASRLIKRGAFDTFLSGFTRPPPAAAGPPDERTFRVTIQDIQHATNIAVGDLVGCRAGNGGITFSVDSSENCTFADITLFGGPSIGYLDVGASAVGKRGGNTYRNVSIRYPDAPPGARHKPLLSTSADGFNVGRAKLGPTLAGAYFEGTHDDAVAVHGALSVVVEANTAALTVVIASQYGNSMYLPGEHVAFFDSIRFTPLPPLQAPDYTHATFRIVSIVTAPANYTAPRAASVTMPHQTFVTGVTLYQVLTLDAPPPAGLGFDGAIINADRIPSGFRVINNTFVDVRGRGMLIKAHNGIIAGNAMINVTAGGIIITPELNWREGDYSRNLVVADNLIRSVAHAAHTFGGIAIGVIAPDKRLGQLVGHVNINVLNNVLDDVGYGPLWISSAANVSVTNNTILRPFLPPFGSCCEPIASGAAFYATNVTQLTLAGNCVVPGNGSELTQLAVVDARVEFSPQSERGIAVCNYPTTSHSPSPSAALSPVASITGSASAAASTSPSTPPLSTMRAAASSASPAASARVSPYALSTSATASKSALAAGFAGVADASESPSALGTTGGGSLAAGAAAHASALPSDTVAIAFCVGVATFVAAAGALVLVRRWLTQPKAVSLRSPLSALQASTNLNRFGGPDSVHVDSPLGRPAARRASTPHGAAGSPSPR